jgi:hypothetical protein
MGAAELAIWASIDGAVRDYRRHFRHGVLQGVYRKIVVDRGTAVCPQSSL